MSAPAAAPAGDAAAKKGGGKNKLFIIGGVVLAVFTWGLTKNALIPVKDPRILESINHENA